MAGIDLGELYGKLEFLTTLARWNPDHEEAGPHLLPGPRGTEAEEPIS